MGSQIQLEVYLPGSTSTVNLSVLSDYIFVRASSGTSPTLSEVYFFGNSANPTRQTYVFNSNASVDDIVAASNDSLVSCTVVTVGENRLAVPVQHAFPAAGYEIDEVLNNSVINSLITYRNVIYGVEELIGDLVTAANAGGGGGGGGINPLLPVTGTGNATGNVTGNLSGHRLQVQQAGSDLLDINPAVGYVSLNSGGANSIAISETNNEIDYTSQEHLFGGEVQIHGILGTLTVGNNSNNSNVNLRADSGAGAQLLFTNLAIHTTTIDAELITAARHIQIMDADGIIPVTSGTTFTGTLAAAISGSKNVVNGVIVD